MIWWFWDWGFTANYPIPDFTYPQKDLEYRIWVPFTRLVALRRLHRVQHRT